MLSLHHPNQEAANLMNSNQFLTIYGLLAKFEPVQPKTQLKMTEIRGYIYETLDAEGLTIESFQ